MTKNKRNSTYLILKCIINLINIFNNSFFELKIIENTIYVH